MTLRWQCVCARAFSWPRYFNKWSLLYICLNQCVYWMLLNVVSCVLILFWQVRLFKQVGVYGLFWHTYIHTRGCPFTRLAGSTAFQSQRWGIGTWERRMYPMLDLARCSPRPRSRNLSTTPGTCPAYDKTTLGKCLWDFHELCHQS